MTPGAAEKTVRAPDGSGRPRRTQRERREATVGRLIAATVDALVEVGFVRASTKEICRRAGVSDGALFGHFKTRLDLIGAAAEAIARGTVSDLEQQIETTDFGDEPLRVVIAMVRDGARSPSSRVWHELLAAARTDEALRGHLEPLTRQYIHDLRRVLSGLPGFDALPAEDFDLWLPLLLHLFDGEAIFSVVAPNPEAEARLLGFVTNIALSYTQADPQTTDVTPR